MTPAIENGFDLEKRISEIVKQYGAKPSALIMVLQDIQKHYRYLPKDALVLVGKKMKLPLAQIYGVATFYRTFSLTPKGKNHICVCTGTSCHVRQSADILEHLERKLGLKAGETSLDLEYSLEGVNCLGACALGPLVTANNQYFGNMTAAKVDQMLTELEQKKGKPEPAGELA
jgi:NADH:ubiquinone oxidoreductase subunit E